ncbi:MAG: hypothetical protein Q4E12_03730 [Coriobacteriia bacterium]|nr:hypothetical protein [Coriobacteriia bacterium]
MERWAQPMGTPEQEAALCEKLVDGYFLSGFFPWAEADRAEASTSAEAAEQVRRLLILALRLRLLLQDRGGAIGEEDLRPLGFAFGKPDGAQRIAPCWSFRIPAKGRSYSALLESYYTRLLPRILEGEGQKGRNVMRRLEFRWDGEEALLLLSLGLDSAKGWPAACAEALLETLCDLHLTRVTVCASVAHGIGLQTTDGLTALWVALAQSFTSGRLGQCPVCGKFFRATSERKNKRVYCESGGGCAQAAARTRAFAAACEAGTPPREAARGISVQTALKTMGKLGITRLEGIDYGEE